MWRSSNPAALQSAGSVQRIQHRTEGLSDAPGLSRRGVCDLSLCEHDSTCVCKMTVFYESWIQISN
eukprot:5504527-Amphidinium_carterae.1